LICTEVFFGLHIKILKMHIWLNFRIGGGNCPISPSGYAPVFSSALFSISCNRHGKRFCSLANFLNPKSSLQNQLSNNPNQSKHLTC